MQIAMTSARMYNYVRVCAHVWCSVARASVCASDSMLNEDDRGNAEASCCIEVPRRLRTRRTPRLALPSCTLHLAVSVRHLAGFLLPSDPLTSFNNLLTPRERLFTIHHVKMNICCERETQQRLRE